MKFLWIISSLFVLFSCSDKIDYAKSLEDEKKQGLTQEEAKLRSSLISQPKYLLKLVIGEEDKFSGQVKIDFNVKKKGVVRIDFSDGAISSVIANGKKVKDFYYNSKFFLIDSELLRLGANSLVVDFERSYSNDGSGLYRFVDPEDKKHYMYTDFEPFSSNKLFPNFDQPDLKAFYSLEVLAPSDWKVITYAREKGKTPEGQKVRWIFPESDEFSTYIFSMHAGPYHVWEKAGKIPLRLFSRQSMAKYVKPDFWFDMTEKGFRFFNSYFGISYPFKKYDQIIVPDFNWGAMENVAAVTFREGFVSKGEATRKNRRSLANTIFHEMAHMWFGNLVTMKWWNGLWLNESFATFMAYLALDNATDFKEAWKTFYSRTKQWAYWEDQLVTTHPIELPVLNTSSAFTNFDGITYGKGASSLKQLHFLLGADKFKKGIQYYFKTHAYKNTTLQDFFTALEKGSGRQLSKWSDQWLKKAGLNSIQASFDCRDNKITKFTLKQTAPKKHPQLREHRLILGLFRFTEGKLELFSEKDILITSGDNLQKDLAGLSCPDFVYPNINDEAYIKVVLDQKSLGALKENYTNIDHDFTRLMLSKDLWSMFLDSKIKYEELLSIILPNLDKEKDHSIVVNHLKSLEQLRGYIIFHKKEDKSVSWLKDLEEITSEKFKSSKEGSDLQKEWFKVFVEYAYSEEKLNELKAMLGFKSVNGLKIDQTKKWEIIKKLSANQVKGALELAKRERKLDPSSEGDKGLLYASAALKGKSNKKNWLKEIKKEEKSLGDLRSIMKGLMPLERVEDIKTRSKMLGAILDTLEDKAEKSSHSFLKDFTWNLVKADCSADFTEEIEDFLDEEDVPAVVRKNLRKIRQENERCLSIVQKSLEKSSNI